MVTARSRLARYQSANRLADPTVGFVIHELEKRGHPRPSKVTQAWLRQAYILLGIPQRKSGTVKDGDDDPRNHAAQEADLGPLFR